jgi:hypothetical protein
LPIVDCSLDNKHGVRRRRQDVTLTLLGDEILDPTIYVVFGKTFDTEFDAAFDLDFDAGLDVALDGERDFFVLRDLDDISNFGKLFVIPL